MNVKRAVVAGSLGAAATSLAVLGFAAPSSAAGDLSIAGDASFDCLLLPFNSAFKYDSEMVLTATEADGATKLSASLSDIPALAPVAIEGGQMQVTLVGSVGGTPFELIGDSGVDVDALEAVEVPELVGEVPVAEGEVVLTKFSFEFEEMMNLSITSGCDAGTGANMGLMSTVDVSAGSDTEPVVAEEELAEASREEESSSMPMMLGGGAAVVVLGGAAAWFFTRRKTA